MTGVSNDLIYEVLKAVPARLGNFESKLVDHDNPFLSLSSQLRGIHAQSDALHQDVTNIYQRLGQMDQRIARIENRLNLVDETAG